MAEEEKEEEPKKGGLMRIIMLVVGAIALIAVGVGAGYFLFGGKPADPSEEIEEIMREK
jgi:Flagellar basal body-associated protein